MQAIRAALTASVPGSVSSSVCVMVLGFGPNLSAPGPKLDLTLGVNPFVAQILRAQLPFLYECSFMF